MSKQIHAKLDRIIARIVETVDPEKIILFGSRSEGTNNTNSDYDLCILKSGISSKRKLAQKIYLQLLGLFSAVDLIVETPERFAQLVKDPYLIYSEIAEKGRVVYEK